MDKAETDRIWKEFWQRQQTSQAPGIVSAQWNAISQAQFEVWARVSQIFRRDAKILDVATGAGKLPQMLRYLRADFSTVGIDIANPLPSSSIGIELIGGVSMERLPFPAAHFDGAVSQFGFEYGDTQSTAREILKVLKPGSPIALMVHRGDGPILAHNELRRRQLFWVLDENALFDRVRTMLDMPDTTIIEAADFAGELATSGQKQFGAHAVAWEIPEAVRRSLVLGASGPRAKLMDTLELIEMQARNELGRIASLAKACATADDRALLLRGFSDQGRKIQDVIPAALPNEKAFADVIVL